MLIPVGRKPQTVNDVVELLQNTREHMDAKLLESIKNASQSAAGQSAVEWTCAKGVIEQLLVAIG